MSISAWSRSSKSLRAQRRDYRTSTDFQISVLVSRSRFSARACVKVAPHTLLRGTREVRRSSARAGDGESRSRWRPRDLFGVRRWLLVWKRSWRSGSAATPPQRQHQQCHALRILVRSLAAVELGRTLALWPPRYRTCTHCHANTNGRLGQEGLHMCPRAEFALGHLYVVVWCCL